MVESRPEMKREYALTRIYPSWWHFSGQLVTVFGLAGGGIYLLIAQTHEAPIGLLLVGAAVVLFGMVTLERHYTSWSLTSDRLIERRGILASHRREMELADVRSIEVDRTLMQRMLGLGNVLVASAASADFLIRLWDIPDPERVAEIVRQARLKRLA
jgi:uncharacterized membrane protein YdbT with pleckstrin-like domain